MDLVSVIVTVQSGKQLVRCIESVVNQAYFEIELVLVDDGSTDGSAAICDAYARQDARIKVVHQERQGLRAARTAGLKVAFGEYVMFLNCDDYLGIYAIERMLKTIKSSKADICVCGIRYVDEKDELLAWKSPHKSEVVEDIELISYKLYQGNTCWREEFNKLYWMGLFDHMVLPGAKGLEQDNLIDCVANQVKRVALNHHRLYNYGVTEQRPLPTKRNCSKNPDNAWVSMVKTTVMQLCLVFLGWVSIKLTK